MQMKLRVLRSLTWLGVVHGIRNVKARRQRYQSRKEWDVFANVFLCEDGVRLCYR